MVAVPTHSVRKGALFGVSSIAVVLLATALALDWSVAARAGIIAALCLVLWLTGWVAVWIPTLILWATVPLALANAGPPYHLLTVLSRSADPVLPLFLCGFALAAAAQRWMLDQWLVTRAVQLSRGGAPNRLIIIHIGDNRRAAVSRSRKVDHVRLVLDNQRVQVRVNETEAGRSPPMPQESWLDMFWPQRFSKERIIL